ncbi:LOW QUALITY PROTEIN: NSFL1 cofactor p47-like [Centruroides vittatus]|uniref:LOW QUALITY PROTEIN: NSFL1 cofactor p47-like n=1 Tax=Centruroides vittatus TaxID=120091 RepID=UPI00350F2176
MADKETQDHDEAVEEFCKITGVDRDRGRLYLESSGWELNLALSSFYEEGEENEVENNESFQSQFSQSNRVVPESRFATLSSIKSNENEEEEGQAFYAGGSERSGQQVLGPGKRKAGHDIVEEMFKAAKGHGAQVVEINDPTAKQSSIFHGTGYRLGSSSDDTQVVAGASSNSDETIDMCLKLWNNGFSVGNGPLRGYDDPVNKDFLESIRRGEIPRELAIQAKGEVNLSMEDHRHEEYTMPKKIIEAFSGSGHRLGSPTPGVILHQDNQSKPCEEDNKSNEELARSMLQLKESEPTTNIQIRLADGSRMVLKMNHTHTVGDIRRYIVTARPQYSASLFALLTAFPSKELNEDSITLKDANILNSAIIQKLK